MGQVHTRTRSSGPFRCDRGTCRNGFSHLSFLERHIRIHDNNLLHCHFCPWSGNTDLVTHINHHFHNRPYTCSYCADAFYNCKDKTQHEELFHEKISDRYKCDRCFFKTHSMVLISRHKHHKCPKR